MFYDSLATTFPDPDHSAGEIRLMCSLLYLKHAFNLSDEETCERWAENVVWQYFSTVQEKAIAYVRCATNSIWAPLISRQRSPHSPSQTGIQAFTW